MQFRSLILLAIIILGRLSFAEEITISKSKDAIGVECSTHSKAYDVMACTSKYLNEETNKLNELIRHINNEFDDPSRANSTADTFNKYINTICARDQSMPSRETRLYKKASEILCKIDHIQLRINYLSLHYCDQNGCPTRKVTP
jgi:hypothetical protein